MSIIVFQDAATGINLAVDSASVVKVSELGQLNQTGYFPACALAFNGVDDVNVRGDLATTVAALAGSGPAGGAVAANIFTPSFDFAGGPSVATVNGPWVYTAVYDGNSTVQVVTLAGKVRLEPNTTGAIQLRFSLPLTPSPLFPYPEALCGTWSPDDAIASINGWAPQPTAVLQAVPGGFEAQTVAWSADGKPQEISVCLSYRAL